MNYYDVLGLKKDATYDDIKSKYRDLAKAYHPDKATNKFAIDRFKRINEAYTVLSDPYNRGRYDQKLETVNQNSSPFGSDFDEAMKNLNKIFTSEEFIRNSLTAPNNHITRTVTNNGNCTSYVTKIVTHPDSDDDSDNEGEQTIRIINNNFRTPIIEEIVEKRKPLFKPNIKEIKDRKVKIEEDDANNETKEEKEETTKRNRKSKIAKNKEEEKIKSSGKKKKEEVPEEIVTENPAKKSRKKKSE